MMYVDPIGYQPAAHDKESELLNNWFSGVSSGGSGTSVIGHPETNPFSFDTWRNAYTVSTEKEHWEIYRFWHYRNKLR